MDNNFMDEYTRIAEVFRTCCTNYGVEDRPFCDECPYSDKIITTRYPDGAVMFRDYTECETALSTRVYEMLDELIIMVDQYRQEVIHGRWIDEPGHIPHCSVCGRYSDDADTGDAICCPFCGAKMTEGRTNDNRRF